MAAINLYFQVHQPIRLKEFSFFHIGRDYSYFNDEMNQQIFEKVAHKCYLPSCKLLLDLIQRHQGQFKITFSLSGLFMEQAQRFMPEVLNLFKQLYQTGQVEFLSETYYHSLAFHYSEKEFDRQIELHTEALQKYLGAKPVNIFRNTELIYSNELADYLKNKGFNAVFTEGTDTVIAEKSPNILFKSVDSELPVFLRNYKLTDDIAFRFSDKNWKEYPITDSKYTTWLEEESEKGAEIINLFMDFETFGEHQWADTGIFTFVESLVEKVIASEKLVFTTASQYLNTNPKIENVISAPRSISWADHERDITAWRSNSMQFEALNKVYELENAVLSKQNTDLLDNWGKLQTSDHFYYMSTKHASDGDVHSYFSPYHSPYDAYLYFINIVSDFELKLS